MSAQGDPAFEGNEWEQFCREALSIKYGASWQKIPSKNRGDWGLEGFIRSDGIVVQCFADDSVSNADRTRKQKGKLTSDIPKLFKYRAALEAQLGMTVLNYVFLVPSFDDKELLIHANEKAQRVRDWRLPWIGSEFAIAVHDLDFLRSEWEALRGGLRHVLELEPVPSLPAPSNAGGLAGNLTRKLTAIPRLAVDTAQAETWRHTFTDDFVRGSGLMLKLNDLSPEYADRIVKIVDGREGRLERRTHASEPVDDLIALIEDLATAIHRDVSSIDDSDAACIAGAVVADWLMRCPLEYAQ